MLFTFFPHMSINNLSIRSMVCYPSHLYYMELELVQIILHFHFNSVDGVRGSLLCILHNNFYIIYICNIFTPRQRHLLIKSSFSMSVCQSQQKNVKVVESNPEKFGEAKEVKIIDVESDLDHGKFGEAKEIKIIDL